MSRLPPRPELDWTEDGAPRSRSHEDVYFSRAGGLAESRAVFLAGCGLPERWAGRRVFTIGELGFGSGLNALAAWRAWKESRPAPGARLHFISVEGFPLTPEEAGRALAPFPGVAEEARHLLQRWPARANGVQRIWFDADRFAITIHHAPVATALARMEGPVDAWFLDGFAPARNADMWNADVFARMRAISAPDARVATYSVAGVVRQGLAAAGFHVARRPGFAGKRERLEASLSGPAPAPREAGSVAVIGAGIAGASMAHALRRRDVPVTVLDHAPANGASGNPVGLISPRLDRTDTGVARLFLGAYLHTLDLYRQLGLLNACGVETAPRSEAARAAFHDLLADPPLPETHALPQAETLMHVAAGWVEPKRVVETLLRDAALMPNSIAAALERTDTGWRVLNGAGATLCEAAHVVIASGARLDAFAQTAALPIERIAGQMEWGALAGAALDRAREAGSYVAPAPGAGMIAFGATYDRVDAAEASISDDARRRNMAALALLAPDLSARLDASSLQSRAGVRAAAPDRAPIAGALAEGLFVLGGLGSRGLTLAPFLAEELASRLCGDPPLLDRDMRAAVDPDRFRRRAERRGRA